MELHYAQADDPNLPTLRALLELPEDRIDLATAKLTIDRIIAPTFDIPATLALLDSMVAEIRAWLPADAPGLLKLEALRKYLYRPGPWNGDRPMRYDFDDPFGRDIRNKLLPAYLGTRKGNCVSMPLLFLILGRKLGLDLAAARVPEHIYVKYRDDAGNAFNLETTDEAGPTQDASYRKQTPMTAESLANGLYMRPLGNRETVAEMLATLLEFYSQQGHQGRRMAVAGMILEYLPQHLDAMLHMGACFFRMMKSSFIDKYEKVKDIPADDRQFYEYVRYYNEYWFAKAESLGWRGSSQETNDLYLEKVNRKKASPLNRAASVFQTSR